VVAELADVWNLVGGAPDDAARKSEILNQHCADSGRDPADIRRSMQVFFRSEDPRGAIELAQGYLEVGFTELIIGVGGEDIVHEANVVASEGHARHPGVRQAAVVQEQVDRLINLDVAGRGIPEATHLAVAELLREICDRG